MASKILSREQMEDFLVDRYKERLKRIIWGANAFSIIEALKFKTEAMMDEKWSEEQKNKFIEFLFSSRFKPRREIKKSEKAQDTWYFPVEEKTSEKLMQVRQMYEQALMDACESFVQKAREEIEQFSKDSSNIYVVKTENQLYLKIFQHELTESEKAVLWTQEVTEHGEWLYISKTGNFYGILKYSEEKFSEEMELYLKFFLKDLNFEVKDYYRRKLQNLSRKEKLQTKYLLYMPIYICKEFIQVFEPLGFKFAFFPETYESQYKILGLKVSYLIPLYVSIEETPKKVNSLGVGFSDEVNQEYKKFCETFHP